MHFPFNVFGVMAAHTIPTIPSVGAGENPALTWAGLMLFVLGLTCDAYLIYHFFFSKQARDSETNVFKVRKQPWGVRELIVGTAAIVFAFAVSELFYVLVAYVTHRDIADFVPVVIISEALMRIGILITFAYFLRERGLGFSEAFGLRMLSPMDGLHWGVIFSFGSLPPVQLLIAASERIFRAIGINPPEQPIAELFATTDSRFLLWLLVAFAIIIAPIFEEVLFRGFAYPVLKQRFGTWRALVVVSAVFAISHMHLPSVVPLFVLAIGLGLSYELTGSLLVPITMHALFNSIMVAQLIYERSRP